MSASAMVLMPGEVLAGYRIVKVIGIGGMAIVYEAEHIALGRSVALKVLSPRLSHDEAFRERFRGEGRHVAALEHPNIVTIYDSGEADGQLYLAMRLVEGTTLADRMANGGMSVEETLAILSPIADALDVAHAAGLVHRDVKPHNILLSAYGHPYLADFGVAKGPQSAGLTATGGFVGSFNYAAPEQFLGRPPTAATDVYALTAVLYQCLTGEVPYPRDTDAGVVNAHVVEPPPRVVNADLAAARFNALLARGMAKDPDARPARASEVANALVKIGELVAPDGRATVPAFAPYGDEPRHAAPPTEFNALLARDSAKDPDVRPARAGEVTDALEHVADLLTIPARHQEGWQKADGTEIVAADEIRAARSSSALTVADTRRQPRAATAKSRPRCRSQWRLIVAGVVIGVAVLIAGAVWLATDGSTMRSRAASSGPLTVRYAAPWRRSTTLVPGSRALRSPIVLTAGSETLAAGALSQSARIPGTVPPELHRQFGAPQARVPVAVSGFQGVRYTWRLPDTRSLFMVVLSARVGDLALICDGPGSAEDHAASSCLALAGRAVVSGATPLAPGADAALASALKRDVIQVVGHQRAVAELTGPLPTRALGAAALGRAYSAAAERIGDEQVPPRYSRDISRLATALRDESAAFNRLSTAARSGNRGAYTSAAGRVHAASLGVVAAAGLLRTDALSIGSFDTLSVPAPPALPQTSTRTTTTSTAVSTVATDESQPNTSETSQSGESSPTGSGSSSGTGEESGVG